MNIKVIQESLGHSDIQTTLNIYADVTKELKQKEFTKFDDFLASQIKNRYTKNKPFVHQLMKKYDKWCKRQIYKNQ